MKTDSRFSGHVPYLQRDSFPMVAASIGRQAVENSLALVMSTIVLCVGGISLLEVSLDIALASTPPSLVLTLIRRSALLVAGLVVVRQGRLTWPVMVLGCSVGVLVSVIASLEITSLTTPQAVLLAVEVPSKLALVCRCVDMAFRQRRALAIL